MFILCGTIGALIISVIEIVLFCRKRSFGKILHETVKNIFIINLVSIGLLRYVFKYDHFLDTTNYSTENFIKFFALSLVVGIIWLVLYAFVNRYLTFEEGNRKKTHGTRFIKLLACFLFMLGCAAFFGSIWGKDSFGDVTADQLVINLFSPTEARIPACILMFSKDLFSKLHCAQRFSVSSYILISV